MMVVRTASEVGLPASVKAQMILNVAFDFVVGLVPFLGDILDIAFKANTRNAIVLESYLRQRGAENIRRQGLPPQQDPSLGAVFDEQQVVGEQSVAQPPPSHGGGRGWFSARRVEDEESQRPSESAVPSEERKKGGHRSKHKSSKHESRRDRTRKQES